MYTYQDGELVFLVIAAYFVANAAIDQGMQVALNYIQGYKGKETAKSLLDYRVLEGATSLSKTQARIWEQSLINLYGLQKNTLNARG